MTPSQVACKFLAQKELTGNKFNDDPNIKGDLGELLKKAGQKDGEAWCAYFTEACFCEAMPEKEVKLRQLFSASAVQTFKNFKAAGYTILQQPVKDALVIWQHYKDGKEDWTGHAGVVCEVINKTEFRSVEGNTNDNGSREGIMVAKKFRRTLKVHTGLNVIGFVLI